jgi:hypothetical protein
VVAAVYVESFAGDQPSCIMRKESGGDANVVDAYEAAGRSLFLRLFKKLVEFRNTGSGACCERSRGDCMDTDAFWPQFGSHVAHGTLERRP